MTLHQLLSEPDHPLGPVLGHHLLPDHLELLGLGHHLLQGHQTNYRALGTNAHLDCHQHSLDPGPVHLLVEPQSLQSYDADPRLEVPLEPSLDLLEHHQVPWAVGRRNHQGPGLPEHHLHRLPVVVSHYLLHSLLVVGPVGLALVGRH